MLLHYIGSRLRRVSSRIDLHHLLKTNSPMTPLRVRRSDPWCGDFAEHCHGPPIAAAGWMNEVLGITTSLMSHVSRSSHSRAVRVQATNLRRHVPFRLPARRARWVVFKFTRGAGEGPSIVESPREYDPERSLRTNPEQWPSKW